MAIDAVDTPLRTESDDTLNRGAFALAVARAAAIRPDGPSFAIALEGPWGVGKTSILNLVHEILKNEYPGLLVVRFDTWSVGQGEDLGRRFFREIATQCEVSLPGEQGKKIARGLERLGKALEVTEFAPGIGKFSKALGKLVSRGRLFIERASSNAQADVLTQKSAIEATLRIASRSVVVMIDDLDRREHEEIREVFRLLKTVASIRGIGYLLAYDRQAVSQLLAAGGVPSPDSYLEKIVQASFHVPRIGPAEKRRLLNQRLRDLAETWNLEPFETEAMQLLIEMGGLPHLVRQPRDIVRLCNSVALSVGLTRGEVNAADVVAFEALSMRFPAVAAAIRRSPEDFAGSQYETDSPLVPLILEERARRSSTDLSNQWKEAMMNGLSREDRAHLSAVLLFLFPSLFREPGGFGPSSKKQHVELRVCCPAPLRRMLALGKAESVPSAVEVRQLLTRVPKRRERLLEALESDTVNDLLSAAEQYLAEIDVTDARDLLESLNAALGMWKERKRGRSGYWQARRLGMFALRVAETEEDSLARELIGSLACNARFLSMSIELARVLLGDLGQSQFLLREGLGKADAEVYRTKLLDLWSSNAAQAVESASESVLDLPGGLAVLVLLADSGHGERVKDLVDKMTLSEEGVARLARAFDEDISVGLDKLSNSPDELSAKLLAHPDMASFPRGVRLSLRTPTLVAD